MNLLLRIVISATMMLFIFACKKETSENVQPPSCVKHTGIIRFMKVYEYGNLGVPFDKKDRIFMDHPDNIPKPLFEMMGGEKSCYYKYYKAFQALSESPEVCARLKAFEKKIGFY